MSNLHESKPMAKALRQALADRNITLSHSDCLELVARQFGLPDWNTLASRIQAETLDDARQLKSPDGWFETGFTHRKNYRLGLDPRQKGVALIECKFSRVSGVDLKGDAFGCMMQSILADAYCGQRLRLTADLKSEDADRATIWMRVDREPGKVLCFDNMMERRKDGALEGTTDWSERVIVLDVPANATSIHYGFFLKGYGRTWARRFRLDAVPETVATTEIAPEANKPSHLSRPANLDFSASAD